MFDLDDFKLLNDAHGHQEGDLVLRRVAAAAGEDLRASDVACRIGGEEFALLLPETGKRAARAAADRLCARVRALPGHRRITVSCGVASFPGDATTVADLHAAADAALYLAKDRGKDRSAGFIDAQDARRRGRARAAEIESMKQLRALSTLAERLNELTDESRIGETICAELRGLVDYHTVRVYVLDEDGTTLEAIAARELHSAYEGESLESLRVDVGEGITGTAVALGRSLNVPDANHCEFALDIPGTEDIDESIVAVPMRYDGRTVGAVVLARLGLDQFSPLSVRLLELLAAQAAVAFENARLHERQRRATAMSEALLEIARLTAADPASEAIAAPGGRRCPHAGSGNRRGGHHDRRSPFDPCVCGCARCPQGRAGRPAPGCGRDRGRLGDQPHQAAGARDGGGCHHTAARGGAGCRRRAVYTGHDGCPRSSCGTGSSCASQRRADRPPSPDGLSPVARRRPESNRCRRLCRPLPNHSATSPAAAVGYQGRVWRSGRCRQR